MEHEERMQIVKRFTDEAVKRYGKKIKMVAVAGATAMGTDKEFSDVDMIVVTKDFVSDPYKFIYKDTIPEPYYIEEHDIAKVASNPSSDWITWTMLFNASKVVYGKDNYIKEYTERASKVPWDLMKREAGRRLVLIQEYINHIKGANANGDLLAAMGHAHAVVELGYEFTMFLNNTWFKNHGYYSQTKNFAKLPQGFHEIVTKLGTSHNVAEILSTATDFYNRCVEAGKASGVAPEFYTALDQIKA